MKKALTLIFLTVVTFQAAADREVLFQGMYLTTSRNHSANGTEEKDVVSSAGLNVTAFNGVTDTLGLFTTVSLLLPVTYQAEQNGQELPVSIDDYDDMRGSVDLLFGPGLKFGKGPVGFLMGGGLHMNAVALVSETDELDTFFSYDLGAGLSGTLLFRLTPSINLNVSGMGAWDFWELLRLPDLTKIESFKGGCTWALSAGAGFSY